MWWRHRQEWWSGLHWRSRTLYWSITYKPFLNLCIDTVIIPDNASWPCYYQFYCTRRPDFVSK
jgi:hypothetical protein